MTCYNTIVSQVLGIPFVGEVFLPWPGIVLVSMICQPFVGVRDMMRADQEWINESAGIHLVNERASMPATGHAGFGSLSRSADVKKIVLVKGCDR